jgi:hypothetical protein
MSCVQVFVISLVVVFVVVCENVIYSNFLQNVTYENCIEMCIKAIIQEDNLLSVLSLKKKKKESIDCMSSYYTLVFVGFVHT